MELSEADTKLTDLQKSFEKSRATQKQNNMKLKDQIRDYQEEVSKLNAEGTELTSRLEKIKRESKKQLKVSWMIQALSQNTKMYYQRLTNLAMNIGTLQQTLLMYQVHLKRKSRSAINCSSIYSSRERFVRRKE